MQRMMSKMRQAILVLGMHRSGTSALTGALGLLGARLPSRQMAPQLDNPKGFFESEKIYAIHERMLAAAGTSWSGTDRIPVEWFKSALAASFCDELTIAVQEDYDEAALFVVKDPRMCRLMPIWRQVLGRIGAEPRFAITIRNPLEVAHSLEKRDDLRLEHGCILWLRHVLEAERETRGARRAFVRYEELLREPGRTAERIGIQLGQDGLLLSKNSKRDIAAFIDPAMRHHIAEISELEHRNAFYPLLLEASEALTKLISDPADEEAQRRLDSVYALFERAMTILNATVEETWRNTDKIYSAFDNAMAIIAPNLREVEIKDEKILAKAPQIPAIAKPALAGAIKTENIRIDNPSRGGARAVGDVGHGDKKFWEASFRLQEVQAELASGPSHLDILPFDMEVSIATVTRLNDLLRQRSARVSYLYAMLGYHAVTLREGQELLEHKNGELSESRAGLSARRTEINELQEELSARRTEINKLQEKVSSGLRAKEELRSLLMQKSIAHWEESAARSVEIETLQDNLAVLLLRLADAKAETERVQSTFLNSYSWRVTTPLRWLKRLFRR
jgi:hypothetical protein